MGEPHPSFRVSLAPADPEQSAKGLQMKNEIQITFQTDRELTADEMMQLLHAIRVQVEEPADQFGNDEEYETHTVTAGFVRNGVK